MKTAINLVAAFVIAGAALSVNAATYYWKPGTTQGLWTNLSNWSTEGVDGAAAAALPNSSDSLSGVSDYNFDLEGGNYTLTAWEIPSDWNNHYLTVANGTLTFTGEVSTHSGQINVGANGTLNLTGSFNPGTYSSAGLMVNANDGGVVVISGSVRLYNGSFAVNAGGSMTFSPSELRFGAEKHGYALTFSNAGILSLPDGFKFNRWDTDTADSGATYTFTQSSGTLNLGGSFENAPSSSNSKPGQFSIVFSGGTVNVTGDVTFNVTSVALENSVTFNVTSGKTVDLTPVSFASGSSITKTGDGTIILPATAPTATISAGKLALSASTYDLAAVTFEAGSVIELTAMGGRVDSANSSIASATFAATIPATPGTAVLYSTDSTVLTKAKTDLDLSVPTGFDLVINGETLSVEAETAGSFTATGNITEAAGWGGTVPAADSDVAIDGSGVIATYSGGDLPAWNSIEVKNGATLRIESDLTLPRIILNKNATLAIGNNAVVTLANIADLAGAVAISPELVIPTLTIESGATLNVPGRMKFSNVNISLAGTIATTTSGGVTFGYADNGETTYIGFNANGGTISIEPGSGTYDTSPLEFCCPVAGGAVIVPGVSLTLTGTTINPLYVRSQVTYMFTDSYRCGFHMGVNNPSANVFEVVFDNTKWGVSGKTYIKGGATFRLVNGGSYQNFEVHDLWDRRAEIAEMGRVVVGNGSEFRLNAMGNYGTNPLQVNPTSANHQAIVVEDGGTFECYSTAGNRNGAFVASNSVYRIYMPSIYYEHSTAGVYNTFNVPFTGFASVDIADGDTMTFTTRNKVFWDAGQFDDASGDRVVALADVPITGGGSIALSNDNVNVFGVIVTCGENTATGTAGVVPPAAGKGATTLYFADGANWAGTVTAGGFATTNLVDATAACTNAFGTLDLAAGTTLKLRVWKTGGVIVRHDGLNVNTYANNGGRLVLEAMDEPLGPGDKLVLGAIGAGSPLPAMLPSWTAERNHDGNLSVRYLSGFSVIIR